MINKQYYIGYNTVSGYYKYKHIQDSTSHDGLDLVFTNINNKNDLKIVPLQYIYNGEPDKSGKFFIYPSNALIPKHRETDPFARFRLNVMRDTIGRRDLSSDFGGSRSKKRIRKRSRKSYKKRNKKI